MGVPELTSAYLTIFLCCIFFITVKNYSMFIVALTVWGFLCLSQVYLEVLARKLNLQNM